MIKDKLNIFWERFANHSGKRSPKTAPYQRVYDDFYQECKKAGSAIEYDTKKLCSYISDRQKAEILRDSLEIHVVLQRELMELHCLLTDKNYLEKELDFYRKSIENDLNIIYRIRNQLIHSPNSIEEYLDYLSLRLYSYVNSIIWTILYYKKQDSTTSVDEVLNSICATYESHIKNIKENRAYNDLYELVRPRYLYIERLNL